MENFFKELIIIDNHNLNSFNKPGVWALFGKRKHVVNEKRKHAVNDDKWYCLQVGQTACIKNEIQKDMQLLNEELNNNGTRIPYVNQFGEELFSYYVYPSSREYLYSKYIKEQFKDFLFVVICEEEDNKVRKSIEKEFAYKTNAIYWRNGGPFKKGTKIDFENIKSVTRKILSNVEVSDSIVKPFIDRYNDQ